MTTTILALIALTGSLTAGAKLELSAQTDYGQALKRAADEKKPMAVLIGRGNAFARLGAETGLPSESKKLLAEKFVCVSVNVDTDAGRELARQFQLTDGLVISSAGGSYQALRQEGAVSASDLAKHAAAYATATGVPATTVTVGAAAPVTSTSYASPVSGGWTPAPAGYSYPAYGSYPVVPSYGSSCPNGRCPNAAPTRYR
jgi:hypothetical protein